MAKSIGMQQVQVDDSFWGREMELVRTAVIPYQWEALNDRVEGAAPSYCLRNFKVAAKLAANSETHKDEAARSFRGWETFPKEGEPLEDRFYGFVFQDSDLYKWLEAVAYSLAVHPDEALEREADDAIEIICAAQAPDGYLDTYYLICGRDLAFTNLQDRHELYCFGHMAEAAVAYYEATGKDRFLNAVRRYADCIIKEIGPGEGQKHGYPGHPIAEMALVRLYECTGEQRFLDLASYFINERGKKPYYFDVEKGAKDNILGQEDIGQERYDYYQAHRPIKEQDEAVGHAVRALYLYSGVADVARLTGDEALNAALDRLWDSVVNEKLYITGGAGGTHVGESFSYPYDLPNDTAYAETCASVALVFFARRMLKRQPDRSYADIMEKALYNGALSGMALDGKSFFYVNPLEVNPVACHRDHRIDHVKPVRQKWFGCACCPPNLARLIGSVGGYIFEEEGSTLYVNMYVGCKTRNVRIETDLPWGDRATVTVLDWGAYDEIVLRLPGWADGYELTDESALDYSEQDGWIKIRKGSDIPCRIEITFTGLIHFMQANPRVRDDIGRVALTRGPLVYCLEEADNGPDLQMVSVNPHADVKSVDITIGGMPMKALHVAGKRIVVSDKAPLYADYMEYRTEDIELTFIPYYAWANRGEGEMTVWVRAD